VLGVINVSKAKIIYVSGILAMNQAARALTSIDLFDAALAAKIVC